MTTSRDFDAFLGSQARRYLATGCTRVARQLLDCRLNHTSDQRHTITATARCAYPEDWSVKNGKPLQPHLSTVDAIQLMEVVLHECFPAPLGSTASGAVHSVRLGASSPFLELDQVPITASLHPTKTGFWEGEGIVGNIRLSFRFTPPPAPQPAPALATEIMAWRSHCLSDPDGADQIMARHTPLSDGAAILSVTDLLRLAAQQAQILIYSNERVDRSATTNLWMRKAEISVDGIGDPGPAWDLLIQMRRARTARLRDESWRMFELEGYLAGRRIGATSLAYQHGAA